MEGNTDRMESGGSEGLMGRQLELRNSSEAGAALCLDVSGLQGKRNWQECMQRGQRGGRNPVPEKPRQEGISRRRSGSQLVKAIPSLSWLRTKKMAFFIPTVRCAQTVRSRGEKGGENSEEGSTDKNPRCPLKAGGWALEGDTIEECVFRRERR